MTELIEEVLRLLDKIGVDASFYPATNEEESPLIRTKDRSIIFTPESVRMHLEVDTEITYGKHTVKEILSDFVPNSDELLDGEQ